jgi:Tol biopolymer transport system component
MDLWKISLADSSRTQLTQWGTVKGSSASHSPDGRQIAFIANRGGHLNIWTQDTGDGQLNQITIFEKFGLAGMKWSPDGQYLLYEAKESKPNSSWDIWLIPASGGKTEPLIDWPLNVYEASWSPDGQHIAFTGTGPKNEDKKAPMDIWIKHMSNGEVTLLTEGESPYWSPDGQTILFVRGDTRFENDIWTIPAAGGQAAPLLETPFGENYPIWSADGQAIFFFRLATEDIWIADVSALVGR